MLACHGFTSTLAEPVPPLLIVIVPRIAKLHLASIGWTKLTHTERADRILDTGREADNAFIILAA